MTASRRECTLAAQLRGTTQLADESNKRPHGKGRAMPTSCNACVVLLSAVASRQYHDSMRGPKPPKMRNKHNDLVRNMHDLFIAFGCSCMDVRGEWARGRKAGMKGVGEVDTCSVPSFPSDSSFCNRAYHNLEQPCNAQLFNRNYRALQHIHLLEARFCIRCNASCPMSVVVDSFATKAK